jgi:GT2 family glycosyltransferase
MPQPDGPTPVVSRSADGFELDANYCLPAAQFTRFMNLWHRHPAIVSLTEGCVRRKFRYTIVVSPHPEHGFARLADTLNLAHNLTLRAGLKVSVVVIAPDGHGPLVPGADFKVPTEVIVVRGAAELRAHLAAAQDPHHLVQFLVSGDRICPVHAEILGRSQIPEFDLVLTDMYIQDSERDVHLVLLPGINPIHAFNVDYFLSRAILRADLAAELLADLSIFDVHALVVAALERCAAPGEPARALHIAFPMLCIAETRASLTKRRVPLLGRCVPLRLCGAPSTVLSLVPSPQRRVSIVICTKDNGFLLEQIVERLWYGHARELADIVVVANSTTNPYAIAVHERLAAAGRIKCIKYDASFSFAAQSNLGAAAADGDILLFLNDDVVPVNGDWLSELVAPLDDPRIGVVGPLLLYPDQSVQHAGMYLGFNGLAGHALRGAQLPQGDYGFLASAPRQVMAVTGAALAMRRADFERLNGFDQNLFALYIQDIDLCLRAHFSGLAVVYNPRAILLHMESTSVKATLADPWMTRRRVLEHEAFTRRWGNALANDPFHNPNFARGAESLRSLVFPGV